VSRSARRDPRPSTDSGVRVAHDLTVWLAGCVGRDHDDRGFRIAVRDQVQVHLASDIAHGDLEDDVPGAGRTDVPDGDLQGRPPLAGSSASATVRRRSASRSREPAHHKPGDHGQGRGERDQQQRPLERYPPAPDTASPGITLHDQPPRITSGDTLRPCNHVSCVCNSGTPKMDPSVTPRMTSSAVVTLSASAEPSHRRTAC
jgi:hypothetical protein